MKNPLRSLYDEINKVFYRCPYWRRCPYYDRDKCAETWVMRECGKYRKYEKENAERVTKLMEETKNR